MASFAARRLSDSVSSPRMRMLLSAPAPPNAHRVVSLTPIHAFGLRKAQPEPGPTNSRRNEAIAVAGRRWFAHRAPRGNPGALPWLLGRSLDRDHRRSRLEDRCASKISNASGGHSTSWLIACSDRDSMTSLRSSQSLREEVRSLREEVRTVWERLEDTRVVNLPGDDDRCLVAPASEVS